MGHAQLSVHELRGRWKPAKDRLAARNGDNSTAIRLHRCLSWLQRAEAAGEGQDQDLVLICQWIALNSLYGQWNDQSREPMADRASWRTFVDRLLALDQSKHIENALMAQRDLVMKLLDDEYLCSFFWEEPGEIRANKARKSMYDARTWYIDHKWSILLDRLLERIYLLRCQLVHGAATFGGKLNRQSLAWCVQMLGCLLNAVVLVMIDHGADEDWGTMCYPPLDGKKILS